MGSELRRPVLGVLIFFGFRDGLARVAIPRLAIHQVVVLDEGRNNQ